MAEISEKETQRHPAMSSTIADQPTIAMQAPTVRLNPVAQDQQIITNSPSRGKADKKMPVSQGMKSSEKHKNSLLKTGARESTQLHLLRDRCKQIGLTLFVDARVA